MDINKVINIIVWTFQASAEQALDTQKALSYDRVEDEHIFAEAEVYIEMFRTSFYKECRPTIKAAVCDSGKEYGRSSLFMRDMVKHFVELTRAIQAGGGGKEACLRSCFRADMVLCSS